MSLREDLIANAVEFLQDSRVAASSEEKKRNFLLGKGLTQLEINEAFARVQGPVQYQQQHIGVGGEQTVSRPLELPWKTLAFVVVVCVAIGNSLTRYFMKYILPFWWKPKDAKPKKPLELEIESLKTQVVATTEKANQQFSELQDSLQLIRKYITSQQDALRVAKNEKDQEDVKMGVLMDECHAITHMLPQLMPIIEQRPVHAVESSTVRPLEGSEKKGLDTSQKAREATLPWKLNNSGKMTKKPDWLSGQEPVKLDFIHAVSDDSDKNKTSEQESPEGKASVAETASPAQPRESLNTETENKPTDESAAQSETKG